MDVSDGNILLKKKNSEGWVTGISTSKINYVEYFTTYVWNTYCCRSDIKMLEIMSFMEKDETR